MTVDIDLDRNELLRRVPVAGLLEELVGPPRHGKWCCPNPDHFQTGRTPPVSVDNSRALWRCHGCGLGGTAIDALVVAKGISVAEAFASLRDLAGLRRTELTQANRGRSRPAICSPETRSDAEEILAAFCRARGWLVDVAKRCGLHAVTDRWGNPRIRFPYRRGGHVDWHQDRATGDRSPKFVSPSGQPSAIWAVDVERAAVTSHAEGVALVVEGPCDGVALAHYADLEGYPAVFALPGTGSSGGLIARLDAALAGLRVAILVDEDDPGEKFRAKLHAELISAGLLIDVRVPPGAGDVDGWRRQLDLDDEALAHGIAQQVAAADEAAADEKRPSL